MSILNPYEYFYSRILAFNHSIIFYYSTKFAVEPRLQN